MLQSNPQINLKNNCIVDDNCNFELDPFIIFEYSIRSRQTKDSYFRRLRTFFDFSNVPGTEFKDKCNYFARNGRQNPDWSFKLIFEFLQYQKQRVERKEITSGTLKNYQKTIKSFCETTDLLIPWKNIIKGLPRGKRYADDRAPTLDEIRKLVEYPDRRMKAIISVMISSGIRLGAWDYLKLKDVIPMLDEKGDIVAAKLIVYSGEPEEYFTFISQESYNFLNEWIEFRRSYGEKITENSWLIRDIWQTTNVKYGANWGLATIPKKLESVAIKRIIDRALRIQGIRKNLVEGQKRHEFKAMHGFRKYFKSRAEQLMKPINVEILMGHSVGLSDSYYRPQEKELLEDYLKAVDNLSIYGKNGKIQKEIKELREKNENNEYLVNSKLKERDDAINALSDQVMQLMNDLQELKNGKTKNE